MAKVLLVEDNEMNRDMLSRRLMRQGFEVVVAVDGQAGVDAAHSEKPDIVLMDMSLPVLDGWEATRQLKASDATRGDPGDRADRARHGGRPAAGAGRRLRRLRHQADRAAAPAGEDAAAAGRSAQAMNGRAFRRGAEATASRPAHADQPHSGLHRHAGGGRRRDRDRASSLEALRKIRAGGRALLELIQSSLGEGMSAVNAEAMDGFRMRASARARRRCCNPRRRWRASSSGRPSEDVRTDISTRGRRLSSA